MMTRRLAEAEVEDGDEAEAEAAGHQGEAIIGNLLIALARIRTPVEEEETGPLRIVQRMTLPRSTRAAASPICSRQADTRLQYPECFQ
mmetsp:Transcript_3685/g.8279  ORF Transcript_3685/g.8279 Transcript_3685/m.8279 type:complete len:88 (+) Transcript_3685:174-437(+)